MSALVTLFGNILQNPGDPRARSDVRLMNLVVSFLSMLAAEEENGGVKRMLGVCSEFERIAKIVLDKSDKDSSSRKKRKGHEEPPIKLPMTRPNIPSTPAAKVNMPQMVFSNGTPNGMGGQITDHTGFSPMNGNSMNGNSPAANQWVSDNTYTDGSEYMSPQNGMTPFAEMSNYTNPISINSPMNPNTFQQPFVPQDLWQMPMTLEWDWADMTGGIYPSFENGVMGDPNMNTAGNMRNATMHQQR